MKVSRLAGVSFNEVMAELTKLSPGQRDLLRIRLAELAGEEWVDDGELSPAEKLLIVERLAAHESNPGTAVSWEVAEARLKARYVA